MPKPAALTAYDTGLASEFHVLSMLHRLGADASLTLGNKKAVDISIIRAAGDAITINVKGVAKRNDWPIQSDGIAGSDRHFLVLLCYNDKIRDLSKIPDTWIVPSTEIAPFVKSYKDGAMSVVSNVEMRKRGAGYRDAWERLGCSLDV